MKNVTNNLKFPIDLLKIQRTYLFVGIFWIILVTSSFLWNRHLIYENVVTHARTDANTSFNIDLLYRKWATMHGGVYVPVTDSVQPNSYLNVPERDITTPSGRRLTLINPAYMTRQVHKLSGQLYGNKGHITSLNSINPVNAPDEWERKALGSMDKNIKEIYSIETIDSVKYLRYIHAMFTEKACLKCHDHQGYKEGDIRGGIGLTIPLKSLLDTANKETKVVFFWHISLLIVGIAGLLIFFFNTNKINSKRLEAHLVVLENEEKYRSIFYNSSFAVCMFEINTGRFLDANSRYCDMYGYSNDELCSHMTIFDVSAEPETTLKAIKLTEAEKHIFVPVRYHKKKDGTVFPVELSLGAFDLHEQKVITAMAYDLTERIKTRAELSIRSQAIDNTIVGFFLLDHEEKLSYANSAFLNMLGYETTAEVIGLTFAQSCSAPATFKEIRKLLLDSTGRFFEFCAKRKDGTEIDLSLSINNMISPEGWPMYFGSIIDITARKKAELEIRKLNEELQIQNKEYLILNEELQESKDKAEESDRLKSAFLANLSHEIRTPMNGIMGFADMLAQSNLAPDKLKKYISIIQHSSKQLLSIINDILDISRIETGQVEIVKNTINITSLLSELKLLFEPKAKEKGLSLIFPVDNNPLFVLTDSAKLQQIFSNLIGNAIKFTEQGYVKVFYIIEDNYLKFNIEDTGIGIAPKYFKIIFERFRQVEYHSARKYGGSGLGLAISKSLVNLLGGEIGVISEENKGSKFWFTIPYTQSEPSDQKPAEWNSTFKNNWKACTILIAEDEDINFEYLQELLLDSGINIIRAVHGQEAVKLALEHQALDLILMDIKMPVMDGFEATKLIKRDRPKLPIIAVTAYAMATDREMALAAGCDEYLAKPVRRDGLFTMLNNFLNNH